MTEEEAYRNCERYTKTKSHTEEDDFLYEESLKFLIAKSEDPQYLLVSLGLHYDDRGRHDLAKGCYEKALEQDNVYAWLNLGNTWYYGKTGQVDYEMAFHCYYEAMIRGDLCAGQQYADMYRDGLFVEKDREKYRELILDLYDRVKDVRLLDEPLPEIFIRLARLDIEDGAWEEALMLYGTARDFLEQRISWSDSEENFLLMQELIEEVYSTIRFDDTDFHFYDLYYLLKKPKRVRFLHDEDPGWIIVESLMEDDGCIIHAGDKWFRSVHEYLQKACMDDGTRLASVCSQLHDFEII